VDAIALCLDRFKSRIYLRRYEIQDSIAPHLHYGLFEDSDAILKSNTNERISLKEYFELHCLGDCILLH